MVEPCTSPETRAALRARYTPEPVPTCKHCGGPMQPAGFGAGPGRPIYECAAGLAEVLAKPEGSAFHLIDGRRIVWQGDDDVLAAVDDADALAGALAARDDALEAQENAWRNVNLLTERLGAERAALHEEVARYRAALAFYADPATYLARWPEPHDQSTFEEAQIEADRGDIARAALAGPTSKSGQNRAQTGLYAPQAPHSSNAGATGESGATRGIVEGNEG